MTSDRYFCHASMSCLLGVPSFALFKSPARRRSLVFSCVFLANIGATRTRNTASRTPREATMPSQNGLSLIFFMSMLLVLLHGRGRGLARLLADRQLQRHQVAPVVLGRVPVGLEAVVD